jgi:F-type H+-transporting ATPase subunit c
MKKLLSPVVIFISTFLVAGAAFAQETAEAARIANYGWFAIAAALAIGLGAAGCGLAQGRAASAALEGLSRNPSAYNKVFVPFILGMALIESLAIFSFVIAILVFGQIS